MKVLLKFFHASMVSHLFFVLVTPVKNFKDPTMPMNIEMVFTDCSKNNVSEFQTFIILFNETNYTLKC